MARLGPLEWLDYALERRRLRRANLGSKLASWRGYEHQTPADRVVLGLEMSVAAAKARQAAEAERTAKR